MENIYLGRNIMIEIMDRCCISKALRIVALAALALSPFGCSAPGDASASNLAATAAQQAVVSGGRNEIEGPRGPQQAQPSQKYYDGKMSDGGYYKGGLLNKRPHGLGTYTFKSGSKYVGEFKNGLYNGQGTYTYKNGIKYVGEFKDGAYHGQGTRTYKNGIKYVGEWKNDRYYGQGTLTYKNGIKHVGEFKDGQPNGQGTCTLKNGSFIGEFCKGKEQKGTFTGKDGTIITGVFTGTKRGTITYPDGRRYEGEWNDNAIYLGVTPMPGCWFYERPHGFGKMTYPDGRVEDGTWKKGVFLGKPPNSKPTSATQSTKTSTNFCNIQRVMIIREDCNLP
jgi:hypothetical protein